MPGCTGCQPRTSAWLGVWGVSDGGSSRFSLSRGQGTKSKNLGQDGKVVTEATVFICRHELALGLSRGPGHPITAGGGQGAGRKITLVCPLRNPIF